MHRVRRTQAERTAMTRAALLDATVACVVERGHRRTTTIEVAHRAGVSPGALLHHFPTKADLLGAAVAHLFDQRNAEFREAMADLPPGASRADAAIDLLWQMFAGPTFVAWLELWVAARTDPELAERIVALDADFQAGSREVFRELFAAESAADPRLPEVAVAVVYAFLDGLALSRLVPGAQPVPAEHLLDVFKALVPSALTERPARRAAPAWPTRPGLPAQPDRKAVTP